MQNASNWFDKCEKYKINVQETKAQVLFIQDS